jgi:hypothetical protein
MTNEELVKGLRQNALWVTTHEAADRIEALEREAVLDAKLLADTQGLLDKAVDALRRIADAADRKHVGDIARAVLAEIEGGKDD